MFKLQRLEITGFKSFADHTDLRFTGEGITAVVGPNGCGKSNVADAIAWVLGEQRVKHLRGGEMKDVIFQGSRNRQPSGMAEVVLHLQRDETTEDEPDIQDIDSTLEQIDSHDEIFEAPELSASVPGAIEPGSDDQAGPTSDSLVTAVSVPRAGATGSENGSVPGAVATGSEVQAENVEAPTESKPKAKPHHRHWRQRRNLALEFAPGEAVSVTRRLYRSGESEYLLNDRPCRLRDIQDLFSGTGLAGGHYAIIEQGRIGQILSAKPMDRRTIIEEAAGITKFRVRQRAAEARLESARSNLSRVADIISEIERQVNSLRRQAAKARRYRILREELRELLRRVYVGEEESLVALLDQTQTELDRAGQEEQQLAAALTEREEASRTATQSARTFEDELAQVRAAVAEGALQRDRRIRERVYQEEQIETLSKRRTEIEAEVAALTERLTLVESELERLGALDATLTAETEQTSSLLRTAEETYAARLAEVARAEEEIEKARPELLKHTVAGERLLELGRQIASSIEKLAQQAEGLAREGERATASHHTATIEAEKLNGQILEARAKLARLVAERQGALKAVVEGHERVSDTDAELTRVRDDYSRTQARLESFKDLDERRAHFSLAVQEAFSANEAEQFHLIGTLADSIKVEAQWERAVEGALGSSLQSVLVPTPDDAIRAAAWLKTNHIGRAQFLVTGLHGGSDELTVATFTDTPTTSSTGTSPQRDYVPMGIDGPRIGDILNAPRELVNLLERTLPERMNARVVPTLDDATALSLATGDMYVTVDGDWVTGGQFVNAGNGRALEEGAGLLTFKRELRELQGRVVELEAERAVTEMSVKEARSRMTGLEETVVLLNASIAREERGAMALELASGTLHQDVERAARHLRVVVDDQARLEQERQDLEASRAKALDDAEAAEAARVAVSQKITEATNRLAEIRAVVETDSTTLNHQRAEAAAAAERRRSTSSDLRRLQAEREEVSARIARHNLELAEGGARIEQLRGSIAEIDRLALTIDEEKAREEGLIVEATARLTEARERADAMAAELAELNRSAAASRDARAAIEVQRAEALARVNFVRESCANELNQTLEEIARELVPDPEFVLETSRARVDELREKLESFGAVNMMALEELSENEERLAFLTTQRDDITKGIASTEEALREIKRRSRERFRGAFEQINQNFSELFKELFGGGRGEMSLIDENDELESGIDIIAQPPGKRLQNVLLLSGGEKAMAALALVLGIFHYRPSPFCLLDEVDAPLDEANIGRFTGKVVSMSANTQFIVITHNKRTMETARALYGVTMQEVGVSKLVSVRFE
ncbi:MAG TPA: chromosome segregation protein SMC [Pyrinomonadaceae bacterium]|nr:chromosome segregation protein SMC [Pyrinomonadaceae bacterium]